MLFNPETTVLHFFFNDENIAIENVTTFLIRRNVNKDEKMFAELKLTSENNSALSLRVYKNTVVSQLKLYFRLLIDNKIL